MQFRLVREDGAIIAGPYPGAGVSSLTLIDIPAGGAHTYTVQVRQETGLVTQAIEARLVAMVVKR